MKKIIAIILVMALFLIVPSLSALANDQNSISLKKNTIKMGINESVNVYSLIADDDKGSKKYSYFSNNKKIVSVSKEGFLKGKSKGNAIITVKCGENSNTLTVKVKKSPRKVSLNASTLEVRIGENFDLNSKVEGGYSYKRKYTSSDKSIARVNASGVITPKSVGEVTITVETFNKKKASCKVCVYKMPESIKITNKNNIIQKGSTNHKIKYKLSEDSIADITFVTSDSNIATIDNNGIVIGKKIGEVEITATTDNGLSASQKIIISNDSLSLNVNSTQLSLDRDNVEKTVYGKSFQNRNLEAFTITNAKQQYTKTLFLDFAVHGFEDEYYRDGKVLVNEANILIEYFALHSTQLRNYRLVIIPCANPDGTIAGKNNKREGSKAFGRCTANHIDINRDFGNFKAIESKALRDFILNSSPDIYLNMHGWLDETIGDKKLNSIINKQLELSGSIDRYPYTTGYIIDWVHKSLEIPCSLVEYKSSDSINKIKDIKMIKSIIKNYK